MPVLALGACGTAAAPAPPCRPLATPSPPTVSAGSVSASADLGSVAPGAAIDLTVTAQGPATLDIDCTTPLTVSITNSAGLSVAGGLTSLTAGQNCGVVVLAAGQTESYTEMWQPDPTLPSGNYSINLALGSAAPLTLVVPVRTLDGGCGAGYAGAPPH